MPICKGDNGEIAINYYSLKGVIDINSIEWETLKIKEMPKMTPKEYNSDILREKEADTSRKVFVDLSRMCELEDSENWRDAKAEKIIVKIPHIDTIQKYFKILDIEYSNLDIQAYKITLLAIKSGILPYDTFGIGFQILQKNEECSNEIKRYGLIIERHADLQIKIGETFIFYYSKSGSDTYL